MASLQKSTIDFIKEVEGVEYEVYKDSAGLDTIGVGHLLKEGESYKVISEEQVDALLFLDLNVAMNAVVLSVKIPLTQNQFDALVSLVFNIGVTAFRNSTLLKKINQNAPKEAIVTEWHKWRKAGGKIVKGLVLRRAKELKLYFS
jgi:lysozyme